MTDDHDPQYDGATDPDQPAEPSPDQPALFEDPLSTDHDIELTAQPEGTWEPEDEPDQPEDEPDELALVPLEQESAELGLEQDGPPADPAPEGREVTAAADPAGDVPDGVADTAVLAALAEPEPALDQPVPSHDTLIDHVDDDEQPQPVGGKPGGGRLALLSVLVAGLLAMTGWLSYVVVDNRGPAPVESTRASALDAGRDAARLVFSYDYRRLDKDFAAAAAVTTGAFKTDYETTTKKLVGDVAPRYKAVLLAEVSEAGVIKVDSSGKTVELLVFLDVQSTSTLAATPKITPRRLKMTMQRVNDRWLVSKVDAF